MAERPNALVLKTRVGDEPTVGSNPTLSAQTKYRGPSAKGREDENGASMADAPFCVLGEGECGFAGGAPAEGGRDLGGDQLERFQCVGE